MIILFKNFIKNILYARVDLQSVINKAKFIPKIKSPKETINELIYSDKSLCRFADGEYSIMNGKNIPFQKHSLKLEKRLKEICVSNDNNKIICIPHCYWNPNKYKFYKVVELFMKMYLRSNINNILSLLNKNIEYRDAAFTQLYMTIKNYDFVEHFQNIIKIWEDKNITIICGKSVFDQIEYNIFYNAKSVEYIYCPAKNAFDDYEKILKNAKKINKDRLIIIILGAAATVLAYDLADCGYRALDIGHIAKDYDWYMKGITQNEKNVMNFFNPD